MPLTSLDVARAQYLWALHQHRPTLDDQLKDLAIVFGTLMKSETQQWPGATTQPAGAAHLRLLPATAEAA